MTSREMVQDSATRNQRTLADAVVATNRFRELDARFKSHDGMDLERQANARGWSDYPATPEQIDLTATVLAADEGVSIDEIKKDFSEYPSIGELQIALEAKGHDTMAIQPDLKNYATPEQRAQLDMLKDKGIIGENELMQLGKYPSQDKASEVLENHADAVKMLDSDEISNRAEAIRSHDGMDPDSHTKQVESWKEDLSAKVGNAFEASRDAKGQPNLNNFALQCNLRGIAVQFANTVGISKTQNADRTAHTEHIE